MKYYLMFPMALPVASLYTYSDSESSFPPWSGHINTVFTSSEIKATAEMQRRVLLAYRFQSRFLWTLGKENKFEGLSLC